MTKNQPLVIDAPSIGDRRFLKDERKVAERIVKERGLQPE
jgi:hypothetical protein